MFDSMESTYQDLAQRIINRLNQDSNASKDDKLRNGQLFIGIGGGPGSGKSTTAEAVRDRVNDFLEDENAAVVLPMDGFHFSRAELQGIASSSSESDTIQGKPITYENLLSRRGAPWTFNAKACIEAFSQARQNGEASLPTYSRQKSDPVPDGVTLSKKNRVVLLEGNYLLAFDDDVYGWSDMKDMDCFDEKWYVECVSMEEQRERLIGRHLETWTDEKTKMFGASGRDGAAIKADSNDVLNAEWVANVSRKHADLIIVNL